jgi:DNA adenine methylase
VTTPCSPLRYPGGKQVLSRVLSTLIRLNGCEGGVYAEPYAGGCGAGLHLLFSERISGLAINDADSCIYAFWKAILTKTGLFLKMLRDVPLSVGEWERQREIYLRGPRQSILKLGFSTFYLNRCNRSGIIANGGLIGGRRQAGKWRLDARFNKNGLRQRIERIAIYRERIRLSNLDALEFLSATATEHDMSRRTFVYLDPPYFVKGSQLYLDYYQPNDHDTLAKYLGGRPPFPWALSYDNVPPVHTLYRKQRRLPFNLSYSARERRMGKELLIIDPKLRTPPDWKTNIPQHYVATQNAAA